MMVKPKVDGKINIKNVFETLKSFHSGDMSRGKAVTILHGSSPITLLKVEDKLLKSGIKMSELRDISNIYSDIFAERSKNDIIKLDKYHPIRLLMVEHVVVRNLLTEMEKIRNILADPKLRINKKAFKRVIDNLEEIDKHHQREENSIFTRLEEAGMSGRVKILSKEHDDFLKHEIRLVDLAYNINKNKQKIIEEIDYLVPQLRFHAYTEDVLLYPVALHIIDDWETVNEEMEIIGYSKFTPIGAFKPMKKKGEGDKVRKTLEELAEIKPESKSFFLKKETTEKSIKGEIKMRTENVMRIFKEYCREEITKEAAIDELQDASPMDIYFAELELMDQGFGDAEFGKISKLYHYLIAGSSKDMFKKLPAEHPIKKLMFDHEKLESFLYVIEELLDNMDDKHKTALNAALKNLFELDKHMQREEETIFSRLHDLGLEGRTVILTEEHDDLREHREKLKNLLDEDGDVAEIVQELESIIYTLRFHAFIENDLLYPVAINKLEDWEEITAECDKIGYCEFVRIPRV